MINPFEFVGQIEFNLHYFGRTLWRLNVFEFVPKKIHIFIFHSLSIQITKSGNIITNNIVLAATDNIQRYLPDCINLEYHKEEIL